MRVFAPVLTIWLMFSLRVEADVIKTFPLDKKEDVSAKSLATVDKQVIDKDNASLKFTIEKPTTLALVSTGDVDAESARLMVSARVKSENFKGKAFLEMWCEFTGKGEYFSKGLNDTITGTSDWKTLRAVFFLRKGENPDNVRINLVADGEGVLWVDHLEVSKVDLK